MDNFSALMKLDELVSSMKKKEEKSKTRDAIVIALAILGVVAAVAGIAYAVYRFVTRRTPRRKIRNKQYKRKIWFREGAPKRRALFLKERGQKA